MQKWEGHPRRGRGKKEGANHAQPRHVRVLCPRAGQIDLVRPPWSVDPMITIVVVTTEPQPLDAAGGDGDEEGRRGQGRKDQDRWWGGAAGE